MPRFYSAPAHCVGRDPYDIVINLDLVAHIEPAPGGDGATVRFGDGHAVVVTTPYAELAAAALAEQTEGL